MTGLVNELQQACINSEASLSDVLRMALLVSKKLDLTDAIDWIESELDGYENFDNVPSYRVVRGQINASNPVRGTIPMVFEDPETKSLFDEVRMIDPVSALESLMKSASSSSKNRISVPFNPYQEAFLMQGQLSQSIRPFRTVDPSQISAILDTVKNRVLSWSLELESSGITGEGMTFTKDERNKALENININNFHGNVQGNIGQSGGNSSQSNNMIIEAGDFDSLSKYLKSNHILEADILELKSAISNDGEIDSPNNLGGNVSTWIGKMVSKAANGSWDIAVGAAGNILATAITAYYGG